MRIFLASTTSGMTNADRAEVIQRTKPKYYLETFFNGEKTCKKVLADAGNADNYLLDSGAFSFMSGAECSMKQMEGYCEKYITFIKENHIKNYFELDVDTIFGIEFVEHLREKCIREIGYPPIVVWHKGRGVDYWKMMCNEYRYIAIGGLVFHVKQSEWQSIKKLVVYARNKGVKVHGLGFTKTKILPEYPFWSVDSASFTKAAALGQMRHTFNGQYIEARKINKSGKKVYLSKLVAHNMAEWVKYQKYMECKQW